MCRLTQIKKLLPQLPRVIIDSKLDLLLTDELTGKTITVPKGRRQFLLGKRNDVLWIFWKSGITQGQVVGLSMAVFANNYEDTGIADFYRRTPLPMVA